MRLKSHEKDYWQWSPSCLSDSRACWQLWIKLKYGMTSPMSSISSSQCCVVIMMAMRQIIALWLMKASHNRERKKRTTTDCQVDRITVGLGIFGNRMIPFRFLILQFDSNRFWIQNQFDSLNGKGTLWSGSYSSAFCAKPSTCVF